MTSDRCASTCMSSRKLPDSCSILELEGRTPKEKMSDAHVRGLHCTCSGLAQLKVQRGPRSELMVR